MTMTPSHTEPRWHSLAAPPAGLRTTVSAATARALFLAAVAALPVTVRLEGPRGLRTVGRGGPVMTVHRPEELFARLGRDGNIGLGEAYLTGAWDAEELDGFLTVLAGALDRFLPPVVHRLSRLVLPRITEHEHGDREDTQANIALHYDLSNRLFELFLDPTMTYSCALFRTDVSGAPVVGDDLETAQYRKIDALLDLAAVGPGTRLLEIGTGWGELALRAARRGAVVRTLTLSVEQQDLARRRIADAGLSDRIEVLLQDYREAEGEYDAVVSVEMIEAVGWRHWADYFAAIGRVLAPGGRVAIQAITMPHERMLASRDAATWITKYVFPGGFLPSLRGLAEAAEQTAGLRTEVAAGLGQHYAETLRQWDERFAGHVHELDDLGFDDRFQRLWHFYLCYCRAGFAAGYIDDHQLLFTREARG